MLIEGRNPCGDPLESYHGFEDHQCTCFQIAPCSHCVECHVCAPYCSYCFEEHWDPQDIDCPLIAWDQAVHALLG